LSATRDGPPGGTAACRRIDACRACGADGLVEILDLGETPLANRLLLPDRASEPEPRLPLRVAFCGGCTLVQLLHTVSPEVLFGEYLYLSSFSDEAVDHARRHAEELVAALGLGSGSLVVEAASNDGYLLQWFQRAGVPVLGIEPARNVARLANERGIPTRARFFGLECARELRAEGLVADVVLGNNVLAHVPDPGGFVEGAALLLREGGIVEFEFPYVGALVEGLEYDTIYHEHLGYFSAHAVEALFRRRGLVFTDVRRLPIHGGSLRVTGAREADAAGRARVERLLAEERGRGMTSVGYYAEFGERVAALRAQLVELLAGIRAAGGRIAAYGASAKGSTLLNTCGIDGELLDYVVDRSAVKQGLLTPGTHLPIHPPERLLQDMPGHVLLLTWNFAGEILEQQAEYRRRGGRFILPLPEPRVV
jgi:SAM-dependent methyltransferase